MTNLNEMIDILAISEIKGKVTLKDVMDKFSCSKRTAYRSCLLKKISIKSHIKL